MSLSFRTMLNTKTHTHEVRVSVTFPCLPPQVTQPLEVWNPVLPPGTCSWLVGQSVPVYGMCTILLMLALKAKSSGNISNKISPLLFQ